MGTPITTRDELRDLLAGFMADKEARNEACLRFLSQPSAMEFAKYERDYKALGAEHEPDVVR